MRHWLRSYFLMLKWIFLSNRSWLSLNLAVQIMIAIGFIYGIGFFYPAITPEIAKYLTSGAPTLILLTAGLVMVPQMVAMYRTEGTFDYIWSLPVPRMVNILADATNTFATILPGVVLAVVLWQVQWPVADAAALNAPNTSLGQLGQELMGPYMIPFEVASVLLLVALVGAVVLARETTE